MFNVTKVYLFIFSLLISFFVQGISLDSLHSDPSNFKNLISNFASKSEENLCPIASSKMGQISPLLQGHHSRTDSTSTCHSEKESPIALTIRPTDKEIDVKQHVQYTAIATYDDGSTHDITRRVHWSSSDKTIVVINPSGNAKGCREGTVQIHANYKKLTASASLSVRTLTTITLLPSHISLAPGMQQSFKAIATYNDGTLSDVTHKVTWKSENQNVAHIDKEGLVTAQSPGTTAIQASLSGKKSSATLTNKEVQLQQITLAPSLVTLSAGMTQNFTATAIYSDGSTADITSSVTWKSEEPSIAKISNHTQTEGLATAKKTGITTIKASFLGVCGKATLVVRQAKITQISIFPDNITLYPATRQTFIATATYDDGNTADISQSVIWKVKNHKIAAIDNSKRNKGTLTAISHGETTLKATLFGQNAHANITVPNVNIEKINLFPDTISLLPGLQQSFAATAVYSDQKTADVTKSVHWNSDNKAIATVSCSTLGQATAINPGTTHICASWGEVSGSSVLSVSDVSITQINLFPNSLPMIVGNPQPFSAYAKYSDSTTIDVSKSVVWNTDDKTVAIIENGSNAKVQGQSIGTANVLASLLTHVGEATVFVSNTVTEVIITPETVNVSSGMTQLFTATAIYSSGNYANVTNQVIWTSDNPIVATFSNSSTSKGIATVYNSGKANITASLFGHVAHATLSAQQLGSSQDEGPLSKAIAGTLSISSFPSSTETTLLPGIQTQFFAKLVQDNSSWIDVTKSVNWSTSNNSVVIVDNINNKGWVTGIGPTSATISASLQGLNPPASIAVQIPHTMQSISINPITTTLDLLYTTQQLAATAQYDQGYYADITKTISWNQTRGLSNAIVTDKGLVIGMSPGTANISASMSQNNLTTNSTITVTSAISPDLQIIIAPIGDHIVGDKFTIQFTLQTNGTPITSMVGEKFLVQIFSSSFDPNKKSQSGEFYGATGTISLDASGHGYFDVDTSTFKPDTYTVIIDGVIIGVRGTSLFKVLEAQTPDNISIQGNTSLYTGEQASLTCSTDTGHDVTDSVSWSSDNTSVIIVSNDVGTAGLITALTPGTANVSANYYSNGSTRTAKKPVTVQQNSLSTLTISGPSTLYIGTPSQAYTATAHYEDVSSGFDVTKSVTWLSEFPTIVSISNIEETKGRATPNNPGNTQIAATLVDQQATFPISVPKITELTLTLDNRVISIGKSTPCTVTAKYDDGQTAIITANASPYSSDDKVAYVTAGYAVGVSEGECTIAVSFFGFTAETKLYVGNLKNITLTPNTPQTINIGATQNYTATATFGVHPPIDITSSANWNASPTGIVSFNVPGTATGLTAGTADITASLGSTTSNSVPLTVTSPQPYIVSIAITPPQATLLKSMVVPFSATATYSDSTTVDITQQATWASSDSNVASVFTNIVTAVGAGNATITASLSGVTGSAPIEVLEVLSIAITPSSSQPILIGDTIQFTAMAHFSTGPDQDITQIAQWNSTNMSAASFDLMHPGLLTGVSTGSTVVTSSFGGIFSSPVTITVL